MKAIMLFVAFVTSLLVFLAIATLGWYISIGYISMCLFTDIFIASAVFGVVMSVLTFFAIAE